MSFAWDTTYTNETLKRDTFITRVRTRFDEDSATFISDLQLQALIEDGIRDISRKTGLYKTSCSQTADGSASYSIPDDMAKLDFVVYVDSNGNSKQLIKSNPDEISASSSMASSNTNADFYIRSGNTIQLYGNPTNGTIKLYGTKIPTLPVSDDSYLDIPQQYLEVIYAWCEWKYWVRRRSPDEAKLAQDTYNTIISEISEDVQQEFELGVSMYGKFEG
jgi:hypothetical protein